MEFMKVTLYSADVSQEEDVARAYSILSKVKVKCHRDNTCPPPNEQDALEVMQEMTGLPHEVCNVFLGLREPRTFTDWFEDYDNQHSDEDVELRGCLENDIRNVVVNHYIRLHTVPTIESMQRALEERGCGTYNPKQLNDLLKTNGYYWKLLHGTNKGIIIEDSEKSFKRQRYLDAIVQMRQNNRHIVYVNDTILKTDLTQADGKSEILYCFAAVSSILGLLNLATVALKPYESYSDIQVQTESFITDNILPELPPASVIVLPQRSYHQKPFMVMPDAHSSAQEMRGWLSYHGVPHDDNMHAAELLELAQTSRRYAEPEIWKLDATVSMHGHTLLRLPPKTSYLYYFQLFWEKFFGNIAEPTTVTAVWQHKVQEAFKEVAAEQWVEMERELIRKERLVCEEDRAVDEVTDGLRRAARAGALAARELQQCDAAEPAGRLRDVIIP